MDKATLDKVQAHVNDAVARGARIVSGGHATGGLFFEPTVLSNVDKDSLMLTEETFGPVAPVIAFDTEAEVIVAANNTPFGLAAYLWTANLARAVRVTESLEYGIIGLNDPVPSTAQAPFGGIKQSGFGREGGHWGLDEYLYVKYVSMAL